jgi:hypothetical protein
MLTKRYMTSVKNLPKIMEKIVEGTAPKKFTISHLKSIGFGIDLRNDALRMARLFALIYCFENSVRRLLAERLQEHHGADWWSLTVPKKIKDFAEARQKDAQENSWLEGESKDILGFVEFGHLSDVIIANWEDFSDLVPSQHWIKQRFDEIEKARNFIAHNRLLLPGEFQRLEMYVNDWNRMVGL